ncbi:hypothetical protein Scep_008064 [Stephania cephalantha]|uniref:Uncharacterized protein n=1 Tax=Stephania cephalantha TaxID=152367 RepID=A0AAP0KB98_9MAGN
MELLRSLLNNPLPPAPSAAPQEGQGGTPHIVKFPIIIESVGYVTIGQAHISGPVSKKASHNKKAKRAAQALDKDEDDEVTPNDVFIHVHTKDHDGVTFIDSGSSQFHEHTQATPDQLIDEEQLYYDAAGVCPKGRVYGIGSLARKTRGYADPSASTSQKPMSQLGMRMDFGANTSQAPPPPPPQEHHQQVGMDPACSPQQQHDDDDRDNPNWVDDEHLGDES